jgi:hypothetical protein
MINAAKLAPDEYNRLRNKYAASFGAGTLVRYYRVLRKIWSVGLDRTKDVTGRNANRWLRNNTKIIRHATSRLFGRS